MLVTELLFMWAIYEVVSIHSVLLVFESSTITVFIQFAIINYNKNNISNKTVRVCFIYCYYRL